MRINLPVTQQEIELDDAAFITSKTDLFGRITSANEDFVRISGFSEAELIGHPHNVLRHPDVPAELFENLWNTVKAGHSWTSVVKNRCKNGDHYWVEAHVSPLHKEGKHVGYVSFRRKISRSQVTEFDQVYRQFREGKAGNLRFFRGQILRKRGVGREILSLSHRTKLVLVLVLVLAVAALLSGILYLY